MSSTVTHDAALVVGKRLAMDGRGADDLGAVA
jgi:hypothetical protein